MGRGRERDGEREGEMDPHNSLVQMVPQVLYGVKIRAAGRPVHSVDSCLLQEGVDDSARWGLALSSCHQSTPRTTATTAPTISEA